MESKKTEKRTQRETAQETQRVRRKKEGENARVDEGNPIFFQGCIPPKLSFQISVFLNPACGPAQNCDN